MMVTKAVSGQQTLKDALCSAMKTSRYAEIISKAESDRVGIQQERERMKTLHSEEKAAPRRGRGAEQLKKEAELVKMREGSCQGYFGDDAKESRARA
ncbi:unnamed protein product [Coffea canephora]|uniref:Uncharacterized protein n=1 Tax=Coffea canephora TaxID=49390 RepID=A0A068VAU0_COFCA|nr:unnamed protein product [Coffea canephora]